MTKVNSIFLIFLFLACAVMAETLRSPNGEIAIDVSVGSAPAWRVTRKGETILLKSRLGLKFRDQEAFGPFEIVDKAVRTIDETWKTRFYKKETVRNHANEMTLRLREKGGGRRRLDLVFRAFDGAVAFRYHIPAQPGFEIFTVTKDETEWRFPHDPDGWVSAYPNYVTSQETEFRHRAIKSVDPALLVGMPLLVELDGQVAAIAEADLTNWAGAFLRVPSNQFADGVTLETALSPLPGAPNQLVIGQAPASSPWRVLILGDDACELLANNDAILNLNPPPEGGEAAFDWVKPGATTWDWWVESNNSLSTELTLKLIDFAAEMGWSYHTIDGGWYGIRRTPNHGPNVKIAPRAMMDFDRILSHAAEKGVGLFVWCHWQALEANGVETVFAEFERRGIRGVKIDFMDRQDQEMVCWYEKVIRLAARHRLMVNYHGAFKPTGMNRTWPNQITREGILGNENSKWSARITPEHCATLPYTRFLLGPGDFTPGGFGNVHSTSFNSQLARGHRYGDETDRRKIWTEEIGTRAHALALCIAYDSPVQTLCDWPERYRGAKGVEALRALPTVWRDTTVLGGRIAREYRVAREAFDGRRYLAVIGTRGGTIRQPLSFLGEGKWKMTLYADGPDAATDAKDLSIVTRPVTAAETIEVTVAPEGGAVAIFARD